MDDKQIVVYPNSEILFSHKRESRADACYNFDVP